jgi:hypothetical protein
MTTKTNQQTFSIEHLLTMTKHQHIEQTVDFTKFFGTPHRLLGQQCTTSSSAGVDDVAGPAVVCESSGSEDEKYEKTRKHCEYNDNHVYSSIKDTRGVPS